MKKYTFEEKNLELAQEKALYELGLSKDNIIITNVQEKNNLLKKSVIIEVVLLKDVVDYLKDSLNEILTLMNIKANLEVRVRENRIEIKIFSDKNAILIGKNGKNVQAMQTILKQILRNQIKEKANIYVTLDVEDYKEKRIRNLEYLAKRVAREVAKTKVETKLDSMNSYERRAIHNALTDDKYVYTVSEGEEPNRYVIIKPREK